MTVSFRPVVIALSLLLSASGSVACSTNSGGFNSNNGGAASKGGSAPVATGGNASNATTPSGTTAIVANGDAGVYVPPSNVSTTPDTYKTSCTTEVCTKDEACFDTCPNGSCCVHSCPGQTGTNDTNIATCCDRMGGVVPGATCN